MMETREINNKRFMVEIEGLGLTTTVYLSDILYTTTAPNDRFVMKLQNGNIYFITEESFNEINDYIKNA